MHLVAQRCITGTASMIFMVTAEVVQALEVEVPSKMEVQEVLRLGL